MANDYYNILGVGKDASEEEIKKAYRKLAHQHHPDKGGGDEAKFKEINEAYQVLGNKEKRTQYDQFGSAFNSQGQGPFGGAGGFRWQDFQNGGFGQNFDVDLGDIFEGMFGGGGGSRRSARSRDTGGRDIETEVEISFHDAAFGVEIPLRMNTNVACGNCHGSGAEPGAGTKTCSTCNGRGQVEQIQRTILGQFRSVAACGACKGTGSIPKETCRKCKGSTVQREERTVEVRIPAGIESGQTVRIGGQGEAGTHGARAGDLYVTVRVAPHQKLKRDGADVLAETEISFSQAALGATITVPTLDGETSVKVPAGTQPGRILRLKGKGAHKLQGSSRGDHLLTIRLRTPEKLSKKAKEALEKLAEEGE